MTLVRAQVIVLAGPSGAGKSLLAARLGLPVLRLDDFYREAGDAGLPRITAGANAGLVDWDHPSSWHREDALAAITALCRHGEADVPVYDLATSSRTGCQTVSLDGAGRFLAEGIFAAEVVPACRTGGLLAGAYCVTQHRLVTFARRLRRDLREKRKPVPVLMRRGWTLMREQPDVVARAATLGCQVLSPEAAYERLAR